MQSRFSKTQKKLLENTSCGKRRKYWQPAFSPFPPFILKPMTDMNHQLNDMLSSTKFNALNLVQIKFMQEEQKKGAKS